MPTSYFVLYSGEADDAAGFVQRYRGVHVPILQRWPGIRSVILHTPEPWEDSKTVRSSGLALVTQMVFDDAAALAMALRSPERAEARIDFGKFPPFKGKVLHQAMSMEEFR